MLSFSAFRQTPKHQEPKCWQPFDERPIEFENHTVAFNVRTEAPPLNEDASGALRVGSSRVLLEIVVRAFQDGATPETIVQRYSTLELADVYAVLPTICAIRMRSRST
jgi:uncharacterized protein (DUF433 family)